jgi:hypothetical protein
MGLPNQGPSGAGGYQDDATIPGHGPYMPEGAAGDEYGYGDEGYDDGEEPDNEDFGEDDLFDADEPGDDEFYSDGEQDPDILSSPRGLGDD